MYTCSIPWVNMKYSQARSYACQGGSMLRNRSPGTAGTMSHKLLIYVTQSSILSEVQFGRELRNLSKNWVQRMRKWKLKHNVGNMHHANPSLYYTMYHTYSTLTISNPKLLIVVNKSKYSMLCIVRIIEDNMIEFSQDMQTNLQLSQFWTNYWVLLHHQQ